MSIEEVAVRFPAPGIAISRCRWTLDGHASPEGEALPARTDILVHPLQKSGGTRRIIDSQITDIIEGVLSKPQ